MEAALASSHPRIQIRKPGAGFSRRRHRIRARESNRWHSQEWNARLILVLVPVQKTDLMARRRALD